MSDLKAFYAPQTAITITLASLASNSSVTSSTIANNANLYLDALLEASLTVATAPSASGYIEVYIKGSIDNVDFDDDGNDKLIGTINMSTTGTQARKRIFSVASAFGGAMPLYWQVRVRNVSGAALSSTANLSAMSYVGLRAQAV